MPAPARILETTTPAKSDRAREVRWAILRMFLGTAQIAGATCSGALLLSLGITKVTVGAVVITSLLTLVSRVLFSQRRAVSTKFS